MTGNLKAVNLRTMGKKRVAAAKTPVLKETPFSSADLLSGLWSPEVKRRREKLIAELNAGWSEESERALSVIAERFKSKG